MAVLNNERSIRFSILVINCLAILIITLDECSFDCLPHLDLCKFMLLEYGYMLEELYSLIEFSLLYFLEQLLVLSFG